MIIYNLNDETCIWEKLTKETLKETDKGYAMSVPKNQDFLDDISNEEFIKLSSLPGYIVNYNFLYSQLELMKIIENGGTIKLHAEERVNKSSGKDTIKLIFDERRETKECNYHYWFPFTPYTVVFINLLPWADFTADSGFYEYYNLEKWREEYCVMTEKQTNGCALVMIFMSIKTIWLQFEQ